MKNMKRISNVTIKRMIDGDPDTSYLGESSSRPTSEFSIDRKHSLDCPVNTGDYSETHEFGSGLVCVNAYCEHTRETGKTEPCETSDPCTCGERGDMERNEYRYFNPSFNYVDKTGKPKDLTPEQVREYVRQDYARIEALQHGDWSVIGIRAEAEILIPSGSASLVQEITSGGLWGIESDSGESYFSEVEQDELADLRTQLSGIGFSKRAISAAIKNAKHENE